MSAVPSKYKAILAEKCPNCRKGHVFTNKSIWPLGKMLDMPECCSECHQLNELEPGFFYGSSYVSYCLGSAVVLLVMGIYAIFFGVSIVNDSIYYSLAVAALVMFLLMPWILRYSRVIYFYFFVNYGSNKHLCVPK